MEIKAEKLKTIQGRNKNENTYLNMTSEPFQPVRQLYPNRTINIFFFEAKEERISEKSLLLLPRYGIFYFFFTPSLTAFISPEAVRCVFVGRKSI